MYGISVFIDFGKFDLNNTNFKIDLANYVSKNIQNQFIPEILFEKIMDIYTILKFDSKIQAKLNYIEIIKDHPFFFSHQFDLYYSEIKTNVAGEAIKGKGKKINIVVKPLILLFVEKNKDILFKYEFNSILKWGCPNNFIMIINTKDEKIHVIEGKDCKEIDFLIKTYIKMAMEKTN